MEFIENSNQIAGVQITHLKSYSDARGRFMETFRKEWFPQRSWDILQSNRSDSKPNVLRGLHYHLHQVDYWYVPSGRLSAFLVDIRQSSPTFLNTQVVEMGDDHEVGLFIPVGVAHGFIARTNVTLTYIVDNYFNGGKDELGVAWNDPIFNLNWGVTQPLISERDQKNPNLSELSIDKTPVYTSN